MKTSGIRDNHIDHMAEMLRFFTPGTINTRVLGIGSSNEDQVKFQISQTTGKKLPVFHIRVWHWQEEAGHSPSSLLCLGLGLRDGRGKHQAICSGRAVLAEFRLLQDIVASGAVVSVTSRKFSYSSSQDVAWRIVTLHRDPC